MVTLYNVFLMEMSARDYYGRFATGAVVLVGGYPIHFTGKTARKDARDFIAEIRERKDANANAQ